MYEFAIGPLTWIALLGFAGGLVLRLGLMARAARRERTVLPTMSAHFGLRSIRHWMIPFLARNQRLHPVFTIISYAFHACLLFTPLLVMGHVVLVQQAWGVRWWTLPADLADVLTLVVVLAGLFFAARRLMAPEVRNVSTWKDFLLVLLVIAPFLTGFIAHRQWLSGGAMVTLHVLTGVAWLLAIPFTRLSHILWFFFSRAYMGSEFGAVRGTRDW